MVIKKELLDELFASVENPQDLMGEDGLFKELKKALLERAMNAELDEHLGYAKNDPVGRNNGNSRNGHGRKTIVGEDGEMVCGADGTSNLHAPRPRRNIRASNHQKGPTPF